MAYVTSNPPQSIVPGFNQTIGPGIWSYVSADAVATVAGAGYFTNGGNLGLKVNDIMFVVDTATPLISCVRVKTVSATAPGATTVSAGTTVGAT